MDEKQTLQNLRDWADREIKDILRFYLDHDYDPDGGWYGAVRRKDLEPVKDADRSLVHNGRMLWTFSAAYRIYRDPAYLAAAEHSLAYLKEFFVDKEYGGEYWGVDARGKPRDDNKVLYGMAFTIYGGSELTIASGKPEGLELARGIWEQCEAHGRDKVYDGYWEGLNRDWSKKLEYFNGQKIHGEKVLNSHLHLIEAYTNFMRAEQSPASKARVEALINIMADKLLDRNTYHFKPYMSAGWQPTDTLISYGHDIEASWLLVEAAEAYGDTALIEKAKPIAVRIARSAGEGIDKKFGGMYYEADETGILECGKSWWTQAEAVNGFFNAWQISGEEGCLKQTADMVEYIRNYVSDRSGGVFREWYGRADLPDWDRNNVLTVNGWKTPYHNGRMCMKLVEKIDAILSENR
jgi:mannobiose 2-epimerase